MSIKSMFHDAIFEDTPETEQPNTTPQAPVQRAPRGIPGIPSTVVAAPASTISIPSGSADVNLSADYVEKLRAKFVATSTYALLTQFTATLESLSEAIPEEGSRFRAALKVLAKQTGVTVGQLTEAYNSLLTVLETESGKFQKSVEQRKVNELDARDQQVQSINQQIEGKNKEIQVLMEQRDGIAVDIVSAKTKLGAATASFEGAVSSLQAEVGDSLQKLRIYFPAVTATKK